MPAGVDVEASGLLDDLAGDARVQRAELIGWLLEQGISVEQIRRSLAPTALPSRRVLGDDGTYVSAREISERTGIGLEVLARVFTAVGLAPVDDPDAPVYMRADGEAAHHIQRFIELGMDRERLLVTVRALADGLSLVAEMMRYTGLTTVTRPGVTELEFAKGNLALTSAAAPLLGQMIHDMLLLQLRHTMEKEAVNAGERAAGKALPGARRMAVAFCDLVGFTSLGEAVSPEELVRLAEHLGDAARAVAVEPVQFVKTIGDAVMLVSTDPSALLSAVFDLIDSVSADGDLPPLRVGVAYGPVVSRAGDVFGSAVNLASRVTAEASPGSVMVAESVWKQSGNDENFAWSIVGARHLKGITEEVWLLRVARRGVTNSPTRVAE
ncbi:MAG: adenylate/guanylate cyclase domain-containing protein [Mycolicibacterium sp.]|uniref:adenylate/guanylate cyclase domain-containing protein n=1 Tax=Mycolicibacterium sp. TaxID=2320850 RepID=UPI003D104532